MRKLYVSIILAIFAILFMASPAAAMAEPKSVSLYDIEVFEDLITDGDFLAFVPYTITFDDQPEDNIDETFIFSVLSPDGSTVNGTALAYPRYTGGYGSGVVSFYFETGMTWEEAYIFRVQESPAYYPTPEYWDFPIGTANYASDEDQAAALRAKVIQSAQKLSIAFDVDLLTTTETGETVLSTYGELYYLNAIPGLQRMCPSLFGVRLQTPEFTKRTWSTTLADDMKTKYAKTFIADFMTGFGGLFSMDSSPAMTFLSIILFGVVIFISVWKFKGNMLSAFTDGFALLLLLMLQGFFSMIWTGMIAFISTLVGGVILFLNKS